MTDLDALLAGIVAHPHEAVRWLIVADWLDDHGFADRAELLRLHRMLIDTCCEPDAHPERAAWQARIVELIDQGVKPCVPQHTLILPGGVPLVGNFIPPGSFLMGGTEFYQEMPVHRVTLTTGFFIGRYPVSQFQWVAVTGTDPSQVKGHTLPVDLANWEETVLFCEKVSAAVGHTVRLPTEAEWEYACRAGTTTHYHYGDVPDAERMHYNCWQTWNGSAKCENQRVTTIPVDSFAANPWGLFDCHGNMWEWCADWFDLGFYYRSPATDPECTDGTRVYRSIRGGAWHHDPPNCRAAFRLGNTPTDGLNCGFRVAFTLS